MKLTHLLLTLIVTASSTLVALDENEQQPEAQAGETTEAPESVSPLNELAWMEGTWIDEGEESKIVTECSWAQNGHFLKRSFSVLIDDEVTLHGDQFIGWDPIEGRIRSWTFDSEGGIGEGRWYQDGDRWLVKTTFRLASGEMASATNVITYIDDDTLTWQSIGREIAGELLPSIPEVTVVRQQDSDTATDQSAEEKSR
jgi:hypothetical protein